MIDKEFQTTSLDDYVRMIKRRKLSLLLPAIIIVSLALLLAFGIPAFYQSRATILIEEQEIPQDFVRATVGSYAAQQIQVISQRILTVENIRGIAAKFNLLQSEGSNSPAPITELAERFRSNVDIDLVSADVIDPRSGRPTQATIAFTLAFTDPNPVVAQQVAGELVSLFLDENLRDRVGQVASTEAFLASEAGQLNSELLNLEQRLADFKIAHEGNLPELYQYNLATLERTQQEYANVQRRIQELDNSRIEMSSKLAQLSPSAPVVLATGETVLSSADRLKALQSEYRGKAAIYRNNHPDVIRLEREISTLQNELGVGTNVDELRKQLQDQQLRLADLQTRYKDDHQDILSTKNLIAVLEDNIRTTRSSSRASKAPQADNPAYVLLETQLSAVRSEMRSLNKLSSELQAKMQHYEALRRQAPEVERNYKALLRDYSNADDKYQDIKIKQREAAVSRSLEQEQKGERFTLIEPPALPSDPISPNRPAIIFLGLILGGGVGLLFALLREVMDSAIHGAQELTNLMGEAPLVVIEYIENDNDIMRHKRAWALSLLAAAAAGLFFIFYLHIFYQPLDAIYFSAIDKLGLN
ncbi:MAG: lipopolysaccharide biosynthesis protein [Halioglobus sp.]|nr:lipopolysaccharide biosynthesis protein [Halioglobus sp.]